MIQKFKNKFGGNRRILFINTNFNPFIFLIFLQIFSFILLLLLFEDINFWVFSCGIRYDLNNFLKFKFDLFIFTLSNKFDCSFRNIIFYCIFITLTSFFRFYLIITIIAVSSSLLFKILSMFFALLWNWPQLFLIKLFTVLRFFIANLASDLFHSVKEFFTLITHKENQIYLT